MTFRSTTWNEWTLTLALALTVTVTTSVANDLSEAANQSDDDFRSYLTELQFIPGDELSRAELEMDPRARVAWWVTRDEAVEDAERFFYLLSRGWCGYEYFRTGVGGATPKVDPFVEAEQAVLARLEEKSRWTPRALAALIHEELAFVTDCHLKLGQKTFCRRETFWFDPGLEVHGEADGAFRFTLGGEDYLLAEVEGRAPEAWLFPSLDENGNPIHLLGVLASSEPESVEVTAVGDAGEVRLRRSFGSRKFHPRTKFSEGRIGGIPVVRMRSFADYYGRELETLLDGAAAYRGEPYVILDIRGNGGGNTRWARGWIQAFTGGSPSLKQALTELISRTSMSGRANLFALVAENYREEERTEMLADFERFRAAAASFDEPGVRPHWSAVTTPRIAPIPNPTTLIVIQDRRVASAGEGLISYLMDQVENVVFVGENTMGALTFGQLTAHRLPHSRLLAYLPIKLNVPLDMQVREARGYEPDFWVPAQQALNHAVAAARAGTIPTQAALPAGYFDAEFVAERPLPGWYPDRRDRVLGLLFAIMGGLFVVANRKRGRVFFLVLAACALAIGAGYLIFGSSAGAVLLVAGLVFLVIGLAKRRKTE